MVTHYADLTDALIAENEAYAPEDFEAAADPTLDTHVGEVVHKPDAAWGAAIGVSERRSAWVTVYSTLDGEPRTINRNNLEATMLKVCNDPNYPHMIGKRAFSRRPTMEYKLGAHKCLLHPENDKGNWPMYREWGLPPCWSAHFPSEFEVTRHMAADHKSAWAAIRDYEEKQRQAEERDTQNTILRTLVERLTAAPGSAAVSTENLAAMVADAVAQAQPPAHQPTEKVRKERALQTQTCDVCGVTVTGNGIGVIHNMNVHKKAAHSATA